MPDDVQRSLGELYAKVEYVSKTMDEIKDIQRNFIESAEDKFICKKEVHAIKYFLGCVTAFSSFIAYILGTFK